MTAVRTFRSLDLVFSVDASDPALLGYLHELFDALGTTAPPSLHLFIETGDAGIVVRANDEIVLETAAPAHAVAHVLWAINRRAIALSDTSLLLHAAAAQREDAVVLLCGASGSGKSTLVAGLVAAGFGYLTDDAVAIDATTGHAQPYPKPIGLSREVLALFSAYVPADAAVQQFMGDEWYVAPAHLAGTCGAGGAPRLVLFPTYSSGARNDCVPLSRAEALIHLAENSFNFTRFGIRGMELLAQMLAGCACYRLEVSDLDRAVDVVSAAFDRVVREASVA